MSDSNLPSHIAFIMDGNGRWAKKRGLPRIIGHKKGVDTIKSITKYANKLGIPYISMFAFSIENWLRPVEETSFLMGLLDDYINTESATLQENNIVLRASGKLDMLPESSRTLVNGLIDDTKTNTGMVLNLVISYGSRDEITDACISIANDISSNKITASEITTALIRSRLYNSDIPDIDLLIRTSGEHRISNFMLWQSAYAELYFTNKMWPEFDENELDIAIADYAKRIRRFGKTDEQIATV